MYFMRVWFIFFLSTYLFSMDFDIKVNFPSSFREYEYSNLSIEIKVPEKTIIAGLKFQEDEKIIFKSSTNSIISIEEGNKVAKFEFKVLPKKKGKYNLKPIQILYFEKIPEEEEKPKIFEYKIGEINVKGRYFYKILAFWYILGIIFLVFLIILIFFIRRKYGQRNSPSPKQA